jgi:hypothetical protein
VVRWSPELGLPAPARAGRPAALATGQQRLRRYLNATVCALSVGTLASAGPALASSAHRSILSTLAGGQSFTEALGLEPTGLVVIETDGSYEQVDSLKAAFDGAPQTGSNVYDDALDVVARHPGIVARQQGAAGLCQTCQECPAVASCGGGLYTHRHRSSNGFANPSVYCAELLKLISHISRRLAEEPAGIPGFATHDISGTDLRTDRVLLLRRR